VSDLRIPNYADTIKGARRELKGISTATFTANMRTLIHAVKSEK
jgi:hypothetical protein